MASPVKFVVIVCGTTHPDGIEFNKMADAHARELVAFYASKVDDPAPLAPLGTPVRYLHFDVTLGVVHVAEQIVKKSKTVTYKWKLLADFASTVGTTAENPQTFVTLPANVRPLRFKGASDPDFGTGDQKHVFQQEDAHGTARDVSGVMSITDVYRSIRGAPNKSVIDLVFFTHGFSGGPVIVNSFESSPLPDDFGHNSDTPQRTPSDKDGRLRTDLHSNMGEDPSEDSTADAKKHGGKGALDQFKRAFDPAAIIRVYGCDVTDSIDGVLLRSTSFQVIRAAFVVKIASGASDKALRTKLLADLGKGIDPEDDITLDMEREFALEKDHDKDPTHTLDKLRDLHTAVEKPGPVVFFAGYSKSTPFTKKWKEVLMFIASQNLATYHVQMGQTVGVKVLASPQGTSSENEQGGANNTMRICRSFSEPGCFEFVKDPVTQVPKKVGHESYAAFLDFYTKYFKLSSTNSDKISGTNRNFGVFDSDALKNLTSLRDTGKLP